MTIRAALDEATATLRAAGVDTPRVDAEWLLADLLPGGRRDVVLGLDRALDAGLAARYRGVVHRRAAREPLQLIPIDMRDMVLKQLEGGAKSRYDIWCDALVLTYTGDGCGIPMGASYVDVLRGTLGLAAGISD